MYAQNPGDKKKERKTFFSHLKFGNDRVFTAKFLPFLLSAEVEEEDEAAGSGTAVAVPEAPEAEDTAAALGLR